jgi:hypothetical protein
MTGSRSNGRGNAGPVASASRNPAQMYEKSVARRGGGRARRYANSSHLSTPGQGFPQVPNTAVPAGALSSGDGAPSL